MFNIEDFEARYAAAETKDEQFAVLKEGLDAYATSVGVAVAEFMGHVEGQDYSAAAVQAQDVGHSLLSMATALQVVHLLKTMREGRG